MMAKVKRISQKYSSNYGKRFMVKFKTPKDELDALELLLSEDGAHITGDGDCHYIINSKQLRTLAGSGIKYQELGEI